MTKSGSFFVVGGKLSLTMATVIKSFSNFVQGVLVGMLFTTIVVLFVTVYKPSLTPSRLVAAKNITEFHLPSYVPLIPRDEVNNSVTSSCRCRTLPDVIIFGARKCGTSALQEFLAIHPDIAAARGEIFYFDQNYHRGANWYINQMPPSLPDQLTLEKTPDYFTTLEAPRRLAYLSKDVKLLLILRDPVIRSISDYALHEAVDRDMKYSYENMVLDSNGNVLTKSRQHPSILRDSFYDKYYANWDKLWHDKIHIVDGDNFRVDPYSEIVKVEKFLNLKSYFTKDMFYFNATKGFHCWGYDDRHYCLGSYKGLKHPNVSQEVKDKLYDAFRPHMINLCKLAKIDFPLCHI